VTDAAAEQKQKEEHDNAGKLLLQSLLSVVTVLMSVDYSLRDKKKFGQRKRHRLEGFGLGAFYSSLQNSAA
jgi:hypothetical protein